MGWMILMLCGVILGCDGLVGEIKSSEQMIGTPVLEVMDEQEIHALISSPLPQTIKVKFQDQNQNPLKNEKLDVSLKQGSAEHQYSKTITTNVNGVAEISVTLGSTVEKIVLQVTSESFKNAAPANITIYSTPALLKAQTMPDLSCAVEGASLGTATVKVIGVDDKGLSHTKIRMDVTNGSINNQPYESPLELLSDQDGNVSMTIKAGNVSKDYQAQTIVSISTPDIAGSAPKVLKFDVTKNRKFEALSPALQYGGESIYSQFSFAVRAYQECNKPLVGEPVSFEHRMSGTGLCQFNENQTNGADWALKTTIQTDQNGVAEWSVKLNTSPPGGWPNPLWNDIRASMAGGMDFILFSATSLWCAPRTN